MNKKWWIIFILFIILVYCGVFIFYKYKILKLDGGCPEGFHEGICGSNGSKYCCFEDGDGCQYDICRVVDGGKDECRCCRGKHCRPQ